MEFICPLCNSNQIRTLHHVKDYFLSKEDFTIKQCQTCTFCFTNPLPSIQEIGKYYQSDNYLSHSKKNLNWFSILYQLGKAWAWGYKFKFIKKNFTLKSDTKFLDFGCGTGFFIHQFQKKGFEVLGLEISQVARKIGTEEFGLNIHSYEHLYNLPEKSYNVITLWHVLEHLHDFKADLNKLKQVLTDDGILVVAVPNANSFDRIRYGAYWDGWDVPRHLWHFNFENMKKLMEDADLTIKSYGQLPLDSFYSCILSEKYSGSKLYPLKGFLFGSISLLRSFFKLKKASSLVYILKKENIN